MSASQPAWRAAGRIAAALSLALGICAIWAAPARAALSPAERTVLTGYLGALQHGDYRAAFAALTSDDRRYFGSAANYASIFAADRFVLDGFRIVGSTKAARQGAVVAFVSERVHFFDHAHQASGSATVRVPYALVGSPSKPQIDDPLHPWRALAPTGIATTKNGLRVTIRKVSFFPERLEVVATFANVGDKAITVLPFLRSTMRDEAGGSHAPLATREGELTDKTLYTGLQLPGSAQYTGAINFRTANRYMPKRLSLVVAPALVDGGDAPFEIALPPIVIEVAAPLK